MFSQRLAADRTAERTVSGCHTEDASCTFLNRPSLCTRLSELRSLQAACDTYELSRFCRFPVCQAAVKNDTDTGL